MRFYTGTMFPATYRGGIFIAEHGSWNRTTPIGYRVTFVRVEGGRAASYEPFAEGWLRGNDRVGASRPTCWSMPDGALLVSDDKARPDLPHHVSGRRLTAATPAHPSGPRGRPIRPAPPAIA